ncbi:MULTISPECIES: HDOD domain-containing protein [Alteromonadaceae]|uniref:HDOD domain-containing protein n=1 Tax=Alteromonadaceae TaxID=72275 RepID=UPI001C0A5427|nr:MULTISPECIES: HDOD domain-containing protein [Aliiglaciecola]MBU2878541.1 HDOD domain-containing protein [Aliiglaciecola lipolytica]MDO6709631.1 HDOD domain-containing protein [Aliiglaciecola sp. 2_MG-2023]MDO6750827.1 HDOD domain-containing protein [Aliiglaciecola sp. 1_MG-2023]
MSELLALKNEINLRFDYLTISLKLAQQHMGAGTETKDVELPANSEAQRTLLQVEKQARHDKELNRRSHTNYVQDIQNMVHNEVIKRLEAQLEDTDKLFNEVLGFDHNLPALLDSLAAKSTSISKIEPIAAGMPWLYDELIRLINTPKYRRVDSNGKVVVVESLKTALSYLGVENIKMLIPSIAFRRCLPQITDPFPKIKVQMMDASIGTAMSCKKLAQLNKLDSYNAFLLGLFHDFGKIVIVRLFFKLFEQVHREAVLEAQNERKRDEHFALGEVVPSETFLLNALTTYGYSLSTELISRMPFKRLVFVEAMNEFANYKEIGEMSPFGKVLAQGEAYNRYRTLKSNKLISLDEAKIYLRQFCFPKGALGELKKTNLRDFDIILDEK